MLFCALSYLNVSDTSTCGCSYFGIMVQLDNAAATAAALKRGLKKFCFMFGPCCFSDGLPMRSEAV